jgi:3-hydroxybutyryl-CoA dehydrogenase
MVGTDLTLAIHDYILKHLERSPDPSPLLKEKVKQGKLGFKSGEGFQKWSADDAQKSRNALVEYLLEVTRKS